MAISLAETMPKREQLTTKRQLLDATRQAGFIRDDDYEAIVESIRFDEEMADLIAARSRT